MCDEITTISKKCEEPLDELHMSIASFLTAIEVYMK